jgi:uncharacterized membrane protein YphA (DoxX/SURF4 family)
MNYSIPITITGYSERRSRLAQALYWVPTILLAVTELGSGVGDALRGEAALTVFRHLGYPDYFALLLGVAKILGGVAIIAPVPRLIREWAYAGITFDVLAAIISILAVGDPPTKVLIPVYVLSMTLISLWTWRKRTVN